MARLLTDEQKERKREADRKYLKDPAVREKKLEADRKRRFEKWAGMTQAEFDATTAEIGEK